MSLKSTYLFGNQLMLSEIILSQTSHFANTDDSIAMKLVSKFLCFVKCV